jgi:uncharacterized protein (DUF433 family)
VLVKYKETVEIITDPVIQGGKPCFKGTRLPVDVILFALAAGETRQDIFGSYPGLPIGGIEAAVEWGRERELAL